MPELHMKKEITQPDIETLLKVGAHFAMSRSRRHPSAKPFIFGIKQKTEIFNLELTLESLLKAGDYARSIGEKKGTILFVGGKNEAREAIRSHASAANAPFVAGRFIGGTLTNFPEIKKRIAKLEQLTGEKERGELAKYTKKERLLIDKEIARLQEMFSGISSLKGMPHALFVVDPRKEWIAVAEARKMNIPVIALASSDCNLNEIEFPIPCNDSAIPSIAYVTQFIAQSYEEGMRAASQKKSEQEETLSK